MSWPARLTHKRNTTGLALGSAASAAALRKRTEAGLAYARDWRERMRPHFDALFGAEPKHSHDDGGTR